MGEKLYQCGIAVFWVAALFVLVNCGGGGETLLVEGTLNGGGKIVRDFGNATFTYNGSNCGAPEVEPSGHFNFIDKYPEPGSDFENTKNGVMADGTITAATVCTVDSSTYNGTTGCADAGIQVGVCPLGGYMFTFDYRNKNKAVTAGTGTGGACVVDNGEGRNASGADFAAIGFQTGPYAGYFTNGDVSGNAQIGLCP